jgi:hypothetical protein
MEIWKEVKGFENCYEVSSLGNIRSKERFVKHYIGSLRKYKSKEKKQRLNKHGYYRCSIKENGLRYCLTTHRIVANAFLENKENKPQVNHINGIKTDNRFENLEWCTNKENSEHAVKNRLIKTKLTDEEAIEIYKSDLSLRKLGKIHKVDSSIIWRIKNKISYRHIHVK